jgi:hypothetical protein
MNGIFDLSLFPSVKVLLKIIIFRSSRTAKTHFCCFYSTKYRLKDFNIKKRRVNQLFFRICHYENVTNFVVYVQSMDK